MEMLGTKLRVIEGGRVMFWCPGCEEAHQIVIEGQNAWGFNGNGDAPTFTPSVLMTSGHYVSFHKPGDPCWCQYEERFGQAAPFKCKRCHSFVRDGRIQFLGDCSHALANQTVDLPDFPADRYAQ